MAEQDFDINIRTKADTTGIKEVDAGLDAIAKRQADAEAKWAQSPLNPKNQAGGGGIAALGGSPPGGGGVGGLGSAVGIGTIISALTTAIHVWERFEDEQDKIIEKMVRATEKSHELGLSVADTLDAMKSEERIDTEPLEVSFARLTQKVRELKEEIKQSFGAGEYEDTKKYIAALGVVESQVDRVTTAMDKEAAAADRAAKQREKAFEKELSAKRQFEQSALESSSSQAQAILSNEEAARKARAQGRERDADLFQKTADQLKKSARPEQLDEYEQLEALRQRREGLRPGRPAGPGESQELVDQIERNRKAAEDAQRPTLEPGGERGTGGPSMTGEAAAAKRHEESMLIWREMLGQWK